MILSYTFTTANVHDSQIALVLNQELEQLRCYGENCYLSHIYFSFATPFVLLKGKFLYEVVEFLLLNLIFGKSIVKLFT